LGLRFGLAKYLVDDVSAFDSAHPDSPATFAILADPRDGVLRPYGN
jgi:hypothetical protein